MIKKSHQDQIEQKEPFILYILCIFSIYLQSCQGKDWCNWEIKKETIAECNVTADKSVNDECVFSEYECYECGCFLQNITCSLLTLTSAFSCARELRGVRRAFHRQFFCKYLSTSIIQLSLSLCLCIYDKKSDEGSNSVRMRHENRYASKKVHFTCFNTILALSSPCRTQLLPSSDFLSYLPLNLS